MREEIDGGKRVFTASVEIYAVCKVHRLSKVMKSVGLPSVVRRGRRGEMEDGVTAVCW